MFFVTSGLLKSKLAFGLQQFSIQHEITFNMKKLMKKYNEENIDRFT